MTYKELGVFKDTVADPVIKSVFDDIQIPDGFCCIDTVNIMFLDGRNCGVDSVMEASGLVYENGIVKQYNYCEQDVSFVDFVSAHKDHTFLADGKLLFTDELDEIKGETTIRGFQHLAKISDKWCDFKNLRIITPFSDGALWYHKLVECLSSAA